MKSFFLLMVMMVASVTFTHAQSPLSKKALPQVFILGEYANQYDVLTQQYTNMLLDECDGDMQLAYEKWTGMLREMEAYSHEVNFNLDGIQVWLNVFFNKDGSIAHLTYYPKSESKVVPLNELTAFYKSFAKQYRFPLMSSKKYVQYGHGFFPTAPKRVVSSN